MQVQCKWIGIGNGDEMEMNMEIAWPVGREWKGNTG